MRYNQRQNLNCKKAFCILCNIWINNYKGHGSQFEILMKLISNAKFDTKLKD